MADQKTDSDLAGAEEHARTPREQSVEIVKEAPAAEGPEPGMADPRREGNTSLTDPMDRTSI